MKRKTLWNDGWSFLKQQPGSEREEICDRKMYFKPVSIPHDWQIYQVHNLYEDSTGWYRKEFVLNKESGKRYEIYFEGVYMDSTVYVNGRLLGEWKYGYSSFFFDMTDYLSEANGKNEILVRVNYLAPNSRWYTGAGIYRNVWLITKPEQHFTTDSIYIAPVKETEDCWRVEMAVSLAGFSDAVKEETWMVKADIRDAEDSILAESSYHINFEGSEQTGKSDLTARLHLEVNGPKLWSLDNPSLYFGCFKLVRTGVDGQEFIVDCIQERFGFRSFLFDADRGFFLNGEHVKLNGVCEHHDFGCLGAAFYKSAMRRKLILLKKMGVNSLRSAHNMPAPGLLELADEEGFLVVDEAFDMWERPKNPYDYARFFHDWYQKDIASFVRRDRNHPCILFWSIGNEIYDTHADAERGQELTRLLMEEVRKHDPLGNAPVTIGSNFMPWENARKCADIVKFAGYNYGEKYYETHHREHPDWFIYGSETASTVQSRGIYHFPYSQSVLADEDEQCSSLGNATTSWGAKSSEACIRAERDAAFSMGQFLWTGFDYIGEPTPYHTRSSYFGQLDTAGFPKDSYYIYQAEWTDYKKAPMVHVFPYWDFNPGQLVDVRVCSNAPSVGLFLNGKSLGEYEIDHAHGMQLTGNWQVPYEEGELLAVAYDTAHREVARESRHSFGEAAHIVLKADRTVLKAGQYDHSFIEISTEDKDGYPVENANLLMHIKVEGAGWLAGLDNGDSTDEAEYKGNEKRLFSGKLLAVAAAGEEAGTITVTVSADGLKTAVLKLSCLAGSELEGGSHLPECFSSQSQTCQEEGVWIRKILLTSKNGSCFSEKRREMTVKASLYPEHSIEQELIFKVVNDAGIESNLAAAEANGREARLTALGDGSFRLRCMAKNGTKRVKVISQLEFTAKDLGQAYLNPYSLIAGGAYTWHEGDAGNGNEHGVSTARDGRTVVSYEGIDFGAFGSDTIILPVFELESRECPIEIWEGIPGREDSEMLLCAVYHKKSVWNTYQEETYRLKRRIKGVTAVSFVLNQKIHLKGFRFVPLSKAYTCLKAAENDGIYGDSYQISGSCVSEIGNNVTLEYTEMDFGSTGAGKIEVYGRTPNDKNSIHISFSDGETEERQIIEFPHTEEYTKIEFALKPVKGSKTVRFVFMPGSCFDFKYFRFMQ